MSIKYSLVKKTNPHTKKEEWYAVTRMTRPRAKEGDKTSKNSSMNSTLSDGETYAVLRNLGRYIPEMLLSGESVKLPGVGTLRISFHSKGVQDIRNFRSSSMISGARVMFTPDPELRDRVQRGLSWELGGVKDGTREYANVRTYLLANGIITEDTPTTDPDDTTQGGGSGSGSGSQGGGGSNDDPDNGME